MKSLLLLGYVNYNRATRTYLPTNKVSSLGSWLTSMTFGQTRFHELASKLQAATDETVAISTQNDLFIQYIIIKTPDNEHRMPTAEGKMRLLTQSTSGMALLSRMTDRQVDKICRYINYYENERANRVDLDAIMQELAWTRHVGYCFRMDLPEPGIASLAFPLDETLHGIPLSLAVGGYKDRLAPRKSELLEIMRKVLAEFAADATPAQNFPSFPNVAEGLPTTH